MKTRPGIKVKEHGEVRTGNILIAQPFWREEIYKRSVILLIDHGWEGSTGIILNKISNLSVQDALPELADTSPLFFGGPVNKKTISYIHNHPDLPDALYLGNDLFWGGNYEYLLEMHDSGNVNLRNFHFFAGFVQWQSRELESEVNDNRWWVSEIAKDEFFTVPSEDLWGEKLVDDNHIYGLFNPHPDPSLS